MSTNHYTAGWCAVSAAALALEMASLRSGDEKATLSAHARLLFDRNHVTRAALVAGCVWWVAHVLQPGRKT